MQKHHKQSIRVFRQIRDFLGANAPAVGFGSTEKIVAKLGEIVVELDAQASGQEARLRQARGRTREKRALARRIRREFLAPVAGMARSSFPDNPALVAMLSMPQARDYQGLISIAEAMAVAAGEHQPAFVDAGLPDDFAARITEAAAQLRRAMSSHAVEVSKRAAATAAIRRAYARGRDLVRVLDAMVAPRLEGDPQRLAEWRSLARFVPVSTGSVEEEPAVEAVAPAAPGVEVPELKAA